MRLFIAGMALACASLGFADTIALKNGSVITGTYLGGSARQVRFDDGTNVQTFDVNDVRRIEFGSGGGNAPPPPPSRMSTDDPGPPTLHRRQMSPDSGSVSPPLPAQGAVPAPAPAPAAPTSPSGGLLPAGTNFVIRMVDAVDSERNRVGQTFRATLDQPVIVEGNQVIPRGNDVLVKLVDAQQSGKLTGKTELALSLQSVNVNGQMLDLNTETVKEDSSSRGARTAKVAGGTAALGAIIGAIAGGGKGAAIGAGAGAATGTGVELATSGQHVHVPSETRLTFVLDVPVRLM